MLGVLVCVLCTYAGWICDKRNVEIREGEKERDKGETKHQQHFIKYGWFSFGSLFDDDMCVVYMSLLL